MEYSDLLKTHCLIAGCTGSGKSVFLHHIVNNCGGQLVIIDLKKVEFSDIKHRCTYIDTPSQAITMMEKLNDIMDKRFKTMQRKHLRTWNGDRITVVIDEFMDCYLSCGKAFLKPFIRLSCLARASGIVLVVATQRPTKKVLGDAMVNFDTRVAMRTVNATDSRLILNESGAELLPMYGYCLVRSPMFRDVQKFEVSYL